MPGKIIILRGPSGSGKSTYIRKNFPTAHVCSADHFFTNDSGEYFFDSFKIGEAHAKCMTDFITCTVGLIPEQLIVVDNTNVQLWEFFNYYHLGLLCHYTVEIHSLFYSADRQTCKLRNQHCVPDATIDWQFDHYEPAKSEIEV